MFGEQGVGLADAHSGRFGGARGVARRLDWKRKANVEAGGLMSYGVDQNDQFRRASVYIDKILKGVKPADLPVEQASKYQLIINLKTARVLGLDLPPTVQARFAEVIE